MSGDRNDATRPEFITTEKMKHPGVPGASQDQPAEASGLPSRRKDVCGPRVMRRHPAGFLPARELAYVGICRRLASQAGVQMRTLDRALWQSSKEKSKEARREIHR